MSLLQNKDVILKVFCVISGFMVFLTGMTNIFLVLSYTSTLVCFYLMTFGVVVVLTEISPYLLENYILTIFPFMEKQLGRGVFYAIMGSFCFGDEMGGMGVTAGVLMIVAGLGTIIAFSMEKEVRVETSIKMTGLHQPFDKPFGVENYVPPSEV